MKYKRLYSSLIAFSVAVSGMSLTAMAENNDEQVELLGSESIEVKADDYLFDKQHSGNITNDLVRLNITDDVAPKTVNISTAADFDALRTNMENDPNYTVNATIELQNDIDLSGIEWVPIGNEENPFRGIFNGNNHTISNLTISEPKYVYLGLFGVTEGAKVSDLNVDGDINITYEAEDKYTKVEAEYNEDGSLIKSTISSVYTSSITNPVNTALKKTFFWDSIENMKDVKDKATVSKGYKAPQFVGVIGGWMDNTDLSNCNVTANLNVNSDNTDPSINGFGGSRIWVGGVVGLLFGNINDITSTGEITANTADYSSIGGIAGSINYDRSEAFGKPDVLLNTVENCSVSNFTINQSENVPTYEIECAGLFGIAANINSKNCSTNNITINTLSSGSVMVSSAIGYLTDSDIDTYSDTNSNVTTEVANKNENQRAYLFAGAITARNFKSNISNSTVDGSTFDCSSDEFVYCGGIAGRNYQSYITNCDVSEISMKTKSDMQDNDLGGIVGLNMGVVENCKADAELTIDKEQNGTIFLGGISGRNGADCNSVSSIVKVNDLMPQVVGCTFGGENSKLTCLGGKSISAFGGITGILYPYSKVENCEVIDFNPTISLAATTHVGGVIGLSYGASTSKCKTSGEIKDINIGSNILYAGGIVGDHNSRLTSTPISSYIYYTDNTESNYNRFITGGTVEDSSSSIDIINLKGKSVYAGGIAGYLSSTVSLSSSGTLYLPTDNTPRIKNCVATGDISESSTSTNFVGGLVGYLVDAEVKDSYATGNVSSASTAKNTFAGGFAGRFKEATILTDYPLSKISNCYSVGTVTADSETVLNGPFTQAIVDNVAQKPVVAVAPAVSNCYYYNVDKIDDGLEPTTALNDDDINNAESFVGFDFENVWKMTEDGIKHRLEIPSIYEENYHYENGLDTGTKDQINTITVSQAQEGYKLVIDMYSLFGDQETPDNTYSYDITATGNFVKVDINKEIPVMNNVFATLYDANDNVLDTKILESLSL